MKKTCKECGEEFELLPNKPGLATVCPRCSEPTEERRKRQVAAEQQRHTSLSVSVRKNAKHREEERQHDIKLGRMGFVRVPGKSFKVRVPK